MKLAAAWLASKLLSPLQGTTSRPRAGAEAGFGPQGRPRSWGVRVSQPPSRLAWSHVCPVCCPSPQRHLSCGTNPASCVGPCRALCVARRCWGAAKPLLVLLRAPRELSESFLNPSADTQSAWLPEATSCHPCSDALWSLSTSNKRYKGRAGRCPLCLERVWITTL